MRHLKARQREEDGLWDFTARRGDSAYPIGYCAGEGTTDEGEYGYHDDGHETAEEAERCYHEYRLQERTELMESPDTKRQCEVEGCGTWTRSWVDPWHLYLCEEHQSIEVIRDLTDPIHEGWRS